MQQPITWNPSRIRRILENPIYAGINVTNRRKKTRNEKGNKSHTVNSVENWVFSNNLKIVRQDENFWNSTFEIVGYDIEPLITWEMYVEAQQIKEKNSKNVALREKTNYLLKDLLFCGKCGRAMNGSVNHRDPKHTYYYYRCNKRAYLDACNQDSVRCEVVDNYVMAVLSDSLILFMVDDIMREENGNINSIKEKYNEEIASIEKDINKCDTAILNLLEVIKSSSTIDIVKETLSTEISREQQKKARLETELTRLKIKAETECRTQADIDGFYEAWRNADFSKMSFDLRRSFFVKYIDKVVYYDPKHIDIYIKVNKTRRKLELTEDQQRKIEWKLEQNAKKKKSDKRVNKFVERLKSIGNTNFEWMWHFLYEPL